MKIQRKRLTILANFLKRSKRVKNHFSLWGWLKAEGGYRYFPEGGLRPESFTSECGSSACACGWAGTIPALRRRGLSTTSWGPQYRGRSSWLAVEQFFGLSNEDAEQLFMAASYISNDDPANDPVAVANRIEEFVRYA